MVPVAILDFVSRDSQYQYIFLLKTSPVTLTISQHARQVRSDRANEIEARGDNNATALKC